MPSAKDTYYQHRIVDQLSLPKDYLTIPTVHPNTGPREPQEVTAGPRPIVYPDKSGGIRILITRIDRTLITFDRPKGKYNIKEDEYTLLRQSPERYAEQVNEYYAGNRKSWPPKYIMPKGQGTHPFFPPHLQQAYEDGTKLPYLAFTEGAFKALKADYHGMHVIGLSSITHLKQDGQLYADCVALIERCRPEYLIWLTDQDCRDMSVDALNKGEDLRKRPASFFNSVQTFQQITTGLDLPRYFKHIKNSLIGEVKGLDDLLVTYDQKIPAIAEDLQRVDADGETEYFFNINITASPMRAYKHFLIDDAQRFYEVHADKIGEQEFVFHGTKYRWTGENLEIVTPAEAKDYIRVQGEYYKRIVFPDKFGNDQHDLRKWPKGEIKQDLGKDIFQHIAKLETFVNVPSHTNYSQVIRNCWNMYHPFEWEPEKGNCDITLTFLQHIFGKQYELGLDYLTLLYKKPTQILPILCLVSREKHTGKTTFANFLKAIFEGNMAIVGNSELTTEFNGLWATKLVICSDETFIEKKATMEKIKAMSTADKANLRMMHKDHSEIDFFGKFILLSNNEKNFINTDEDEIRFWVRKVPPIPQEQKMPGFMEALRTEIPAFLHYLDTRKMHVLAEQTRMWFSPDQLRTDALQKVVAASRPTVYKEILSHVQEYFHDHHTSELKLTISEMKDMWGLKRYENNYIASILEEEMEVDKYHELADGKKVYKTHRYEYYVWEWSDNHESGHREMVRKVRKGNGRPYVFTKAQFCQPEDDVRYEPGPEDDSPEQITATDNDEKKELPF